MNTILRNKYLQAAISFFLAGLALFFLSRTIAFSEVINGIARIDLRFSLLAFFCYIAVNALKAYRFQVLTEGKISFIHFLRIIFIQNFFNTVLPFKLGDLSYIHLVHRQGKINLGRNIASFLGSRILDILSLITIFILSALLVRQNFMVEHYFLILYITFGILLLFFMLLIIVGAKFLEKIKNYLPNFLFAKLHETMVAFSEFRNKKLMNQVIYISIAIWAVTFLIGPLIFRSVGLDLSFWQAIFIYGFPILIGIVPLYVAGNFGFYEGSVVFGLSFFGISRETALLSSLLAHAQELIFIFVLAIVGFIISHVSKNSAEN